MDVLSSVFLLLLLCACATRAQFRHEFLGPDTMNCPDKMPSRDITKYIENIAGHGPITRDCGPGTGYDPKTCACSITLNAGPPVAMQPSHLDPWASPPRFQRPPSGFQPQIAHVSFPRPQPRWVWPPTGSPPTWAITPSKPVKPFPEPHFNPVERPKPKTPSKRPRISKKKRRKSRRRRPKKPSLRPMSKPSPPPHDMPQFLPPHPGDPPFWPGHPSSFDPSMSAHRGFHPRFPPPSRNQWPPPTISFGGPPPYHRGMFRGPPPSHRFPPMGRMPPRISQMMDPDNVPDLDLIADLGGGIFVEL